MDCDAFELELISDLYGELSAADAERLRAHEDACQTCRAAAERLRRGRAVGVPLLPPPIDMEDRILAAVRPHLPQEGVAVDADAPASMPASAAMPHAPPAERGGRVLRALTWAGSHAMRPQLAMAAVFVLVVGSSLLLLRGPGAGPVRVTERGAPELGARDEARPAPAASSMPLEAPAQEAARPPPPPAAAPAAPPATAARDAEREQRAGDVAEDGANADKQLAAARAKRATEGCKAAVSQLEGVANAHPGSPAGKAAASEAADCLQGEAQRQPAAAAAGSIAGPAKPAARPQQQQGGGAGGKLAAPPKAPAKPDAFSF